MICNYKHNNDEYAEYLSADIITKYDDSDAIGEKRITLILSNIPYRIWLCSENWVKNILEPDTVHKV